MLRGLAEVHVIMNGQPFKLPLAKLAPESQEQAKRLAAGSAQ